MQINQEFNKMIDSCGEKMTGDELSFLAGYAEGLVRGVAQSDSINYVAAKRFLKVFESAVEYGKKLQIEDTAEKLAKSIQEHNKGHKMNITEYYTEHKSGNTTAMLIEALKYIKDGFKVIYVTEDNNISNKLREIACGNRDVKLTDLRDNCAVLYCNDKKLIYGINKTIEQYKWTSGVVVFIDSLYSLVQTYKIRKELDNYIISNVFIVKSYSKCPTNSDILDTYDKDSVNVVYAFYGTYENTLCFKCLVNKDNYGNNLYLGEKEMKMLY